MPSGLSDADLVEINDKVFGPHDEFDKARRAAQNEEDDERIQRDYDLKKAWSYQWYMQAQTTIGERIQAHFIATRGVEDVDGRVRLTGPMKLYVHVFPRSHFATREDAKQHPGYLSTKCPCSTLEDHGEAGLVIIHHGI